MYIIFRIILFAIFFSLGSLIISEEETRILEKVIHPEAGRLMKMRCTRRFSPGVCVTEVVPVWTFVFMSQNCTERLGCPNNYRTNRFRSYRMCMRRCHALVEMYLNMVQYENNSTNSNETAADTAKTNIRDGQNYTDDQLREGFPQPYYTGTGDEKIFRSQSMDFEDDSYKDPLDHKTHFIVYKDGNVNEDIQPPDVDYVVGEIRSEFVMGQ